MANNAGGHDNITAVVVQHIESDESPPSPTIEDDTIPEKTGEYSFKFDDVPDSEPIKSD